MNNMSKGKSIINKHNNQVPNILEEHDKLQYESQQAGFIDKEKTILKKSILGEIKPFVSELIKSLEKSRRDRLEAFYPSLTTNSTSGEIMLSEAKRVLSGEDESVIFELAEESLELGRVDLNSYIFDKYRPNDNERFESLRKEFLKDTTRAKADEALKDAKDAEIITLSFVQHLMSGQFGVFDAGENDDSNPTKLSIFQWNEAQLSGSGLTLESIQEFEYLSTSEYLEMRENELGK
jgi:hypothetical protein